MCELCEMLENADADGEFNDRWLTTSTALVRMSEISVIEVQDNLDDDSDFEFIIVAYTKSDRKILLYYVTDYDGAMEIKLTLDILITNDANGLLRIPIDVLDDLDDANAI